MKKKEIIKTFSNIFGTYLLFSLLISRASLISISLVSVFPPIGGRLWWNRCWNKHWKPRLVHSVIVVFFFFFFITLTDHTSHTTHDSYAILLLSSSLNKVTAFVLTLHSKPSQSQFHPNPKNQQQTRPATCLLQISPLLMFLLPPTTLASGKALLSFLPFQLRIPSPGLEKPSATDPEFTAWRYPSSYIKSIFHYLCFVLFFLSNWTKITPEITFFNSKTNIRNLRKQLWNNN